MAFFRNSLMVLILIKGGPGPRRVLRPPHPAGMGSKQHGPGKMGWRIPWEGEGFSWGIVARSKRLSRENGVQDAYLPASSSRRNSSRPSFDGVILRRSASRVIRSFSSGAQRIPMVEFFGASTRGRPRIPVFRCSVRGLSPHSICACLFRWHEEQRNDTRNGRS